MNGWTFVSKISGDLSENTICSWQSVRRAIATVGTFSRFATCTCMQLYKGVYVKYITVSCMFPMHKGGQLYHSTWQVPSTTLFRKRCGLYFKIFLWWMHLSYLQTNPFAPHSIFKIRLITQHTTSCKRLFHLKFEPFTSEERVSCSCDIFISGTICFESKNYINHSKTYV
jgi:hypothetical protein